MLFGRRIQLSWGMHRCVKWLQSCLNVFKCLKVALIRLLVGSLFDWRMVMPLAALVGWGFVLLDWGFHSGDSGR